MSGKKEFFSIPLTGWNNAKVLLDSNGYKDGADYDLIEKKAFSFQNTVTTSNPKIKEFLKQNGGKSKGEVELHIVIPKKEEEEIIVKLDVPREKAIDAIENSEGGYKFRYGINFTVEKEGGTIRIAQAGDDMEKWDALSALINGPENPITLANLQEKPKAKIKG